MDKMEILKQLTNDGPFYLVAILAVLGALGVVLEKNIIRAGFSLVIDRKSTRLNSSH